MAKQPVYLVGYDPRKGLTGNIGPIWSQDVDVGISALDWQASVLDRLATSPLSPNDGDRYILTGTGGEWSGGAVDDIATYDGAAGEWVFTTPDAGFSTYVESESAIYLYDGVGWNQLSVGAVGVSKGVTPPVSGNDGDLFYDTGLHMWFYYDALRTAWLSIDTIKYDYFTPGAPLNGAPFYPSSVNNDPPMQPSPLMDFNVVGIDFRTETFLPHSGCTITASYGDSYPGAQTQAVTIPAGSGAAGARYTAQVNLAFTYNSAYGLGVYYTKLGAVTLDYPHVALIIRYRR